VEINCALSEAEREVVRDGVVIIGAGNLPSTVPLRASETGGPARFRDSLARSPRSPPLPSMGTIPGVKESCSPPVARIGYPLASYA
jgi:hypothetical protein